MSQAERWQLGGNAPEVYETQLVPALFGPWAPLLVAQAALHAGERVLLTQGGFTTVRVGAEVRMVRFASPAVFVRNQVAGSPLASHVVTVDDAAREALIREVTEAMQNYLNDDGLAFPIEGQIAIAQP